MVWESWILWYKKSSQNTIISIKKDKNELNTDEWRVNQNNLSWLAKLDYWKSMFNPLIATGLYIVISSVMQNWNNYVNLFILCI